jgi:hypothetical protein
MTTTKTTMTSPPATAAQASLYQQLRAHLAVLKLHACAEALPAVLDQAVAEKLSMTAALERLLAIEVDATEARRLAGRLRFACLPTPATLDDYDYDAQPGVDRHLINELGTCRYLETATNILLIGPPGVGKTHLAVGLARRAAESGYRTYFTTAADLAARCHRAAIEGRWATTMRFTPDPPCWSSTNSATCHYRPKPPPPCSKSSPSATSRPPSRSPPTAASPHGATSSATPPSPPPCWTGSCTAPSSSTSTATATASATTTPAPTPCDAPPPAPAAHYLDPASQVGNFDEHTWGESPSAITSRRWRSRWACSCRSSGARQ